MYDYQLEELTTMPNLTGLSAFITRVRVLATSALSYLTAISAVLVVLAQQLEDVGAVPEWATRLLASAIAVIGTIILQVRRVTPVADIDKGLLPPKGPSTPTITTTGEIHDPDAGAVTLAILFLVLALVCFVVFTLAAHGTITTDEGSTWLGAGFVFATLAKLVP